MDEYPSLQRQSKGTMHGIVPPRSRLSEFGATWRGLASTFPARRPVPLQRANRHPFFLVGKKGNANLQPAHGPVFIRASV